MPTKPNLDRPLMPSISHTTNDQQPARPADYPAPILEQISTHFADLHDPRIERTKDHPLLDIIVIAVCATICGANAWTEIEAFANAKYDFLKTFLPLPNGIPSHDTFSRVFALLDPQQFQNCFTTWMQDLFTLSAGQVVAIDGKTLRGSAEKALGGKKAVQMVSAWASANGAGVVLAQRKVEDKSNEITAIPALLEVLNLRGCIVTIDAMGCQTAIAAAIIEQGADYVLGLKGNQVQVHSDTIELFKHALEQGFKDIKYQERESVEKGHGRLETRRYYLITDERYLEYVNKGERWAGLGGLGLVEAERKVGDVVTVERRYFVTSVGSVGKFARGVRGHWGIENGLHWVLDVAFEEDRNRIRADNSGENMAVLRHMALNLLKGERSTKLGIKGRRLKAGWDNDYLLRVLAANLDA